MKNRECIKKNYFDRIVVFVVVVGGVGYIFVCVCVGEAEAANAKMRR